MRITDIKIDGFGVWRDLSLHRLSPELTVFYGPNEAGKSTLMQFMRSVLYGVSAERRERYLPPVAGGRPGGWLKVQTENGPLTISRYADRGPTDMGKVTVTTADGQEQGDRLLREALEHVDEATYNNIFAVGIREIQELSTLSDTAAAQWLYRLTSGLDRVSLYDVIRMLAGTRLRLLNSAEEKSELRRLHGRREQLRAEVDELVAKGRRWAQSAVKLRELAEEVERRQGEAKILAARARRLEIAINLKPLWIKRAKIDDQLEQLANLRPLPDGAISTLEDLNQRIEEHERQRDILKGQRQQLREEARRLGINSILVRNGRRLEALLEQQEWLQSSERMTVELAKEVARLESRLESEQERLSHEWTGAGKLPPRITSDMVENLAPQARAIEAAEQLLATAKHELEVLRAGEHQYRVQIESAVASGDKLGLPKDVASAGDLVAKLRRRQQVEERIDKARRQADELQQQAQELVDEQVVPMGLFSWLLAVFVIGFMGLAAWWLMPSATLGRYGGWLAALGIGGSIFAWLFKYFAEDSAAERFDACHKQLEFVLKQIEEANQERARLDRELPLTEGSVAQRLQHAERHLAELERVLPVESRRREAEEGIAAAEHRVKLAEEKLAAAQTNWKAKLRALGLPEDVSPENLATMACQCERLADLEARIENQREEMARRQRDFSLVSQRIFALAEEAGLRLAAMNDGAGKDGQASERPPRPLEQLDHLRAEYHKHQQRVAQRDSLRERARTLKKEELRHGRAARALHRQREGLFHQCGVADEQAMRQLAVKLEEAEQLRKKRASVTREIAAAIGKHGNEADFAPLLAAEAIGRLEPDWESLSEQLEQLDRELKVAIQRRGEMIEHQRTLAADHSLAVKQMELDEVEEQIARASEAWRERAAVSLMLERVREDYEQHRQPETLREASTYLSQLTGGKYTRIWTPLSHDILFVDPAAQPGGGAPRPLSVQLLSRGTREQLFVSLRLALVSAYARRGIHLPMILDDVFVNFDADRTRRACGVVRDFARQGHQVLIFTCHDHIRQMFEELQVDVRWLPNRFGEWEETPPEAPLALVDLGDAVTVPSPPLAETPLVAVPPREEPSPVEAAWEEEEVKDSEEVVVEEQTVVQTEPSPLGLYEVEYSWEEPLPGSSGTADAERCPTSGGAWLSEPVIGQKGW